MKPHLTRTARSRPLLILTTGWSGENVLVRLLAASGLVRSSGFWLSVTRRSPSKGLRQLFRARTGDAVHVVLARSVDLFAINNLDPVAEIDAYRREGVSIMSLRRLSADDAGLSRVLCGPDSEVLPLHAQIVEPANAMTHATHARWSAEWLDELVSDPADQLVFEECLETADARAATIERFASRFTLAGWDAPPEYELPSANELWPRVANVEAVIAALDVANRHAASGRPT